MVVKRIYESDGNVTAFIIHTPKAERDLLRCNPILERVFADFQTMSQTYSGGGPLRVPCANNRYAPVLRVLSRLSEVSHRPTTLSQLITVIRLLVLAEVQLEGERAFQVIEPLYRLTPGGCNNPYDLPRPTEEERSQLRVHKEVTIEQDGGAQKTSIVLTVPDGSEMLPHLIGANGANIKALGTLFVPEAGVHFYIHHVSPPADLESLFQATDAVSPTTSPALVDPGQDTAASTDGSATPEEAAETPPNSEVANPATLTGEAKPKKARSKKAELSLTS